MHRCTELDAPLRAVLDCTRGMEGMGMLDAAMTGGTPYEAAWNTSRFSYLRQHPDEARAFDAMMATFPDNRHSAIATGYDFSRVRMIADIGGGNGATLRQILTRFPDARGLIFEREDVIAALTPGDLMQGRSLAKVAAFSRRCRRALTSTSSSACCTTGRMRIACASCAPVARQCDRTLYCCWAKTSSIPIRHAGKQTPIWWTCR